MKQKFLVIDDSEYRMEVYKSFFTFINLEFAFTKEEFLKKIKEKYDGYIIDVMYDDYNFDATNFDYIISKIPDKKPFFIISSQWETAMGTMQMRVLRERGKANDVLGYLLWQSLEDVEGNRTVKDFAIGQVAHYFDVAFEAFEEDEEVSILQISDIEFGNPGQKSTVKTARENLVNDVINNLRYLGINSGKVDFICICGDIAYTGEDNQYNTAKEWLKQLGDSLLVNKNFENMLIVPGNHDYSFNASAGNYYHSKYDKDKKAICYEERNENDNLEYHKQAMYSFAKFVYEINGEKSYLFNPYHPIVKRSYESYGFNFILLNPIRTDFEKNFLYGLTDDDTQYLIKLSQDIDKDACNIVLSHIAPEKYSMIDSSADATDRDIKSVVNALNIKGWFYGHAHEDEFIDDKKVGSHKVLMSRTKSLMLENGQHCYGSGNGFTLFKLSRKNNKVTNISYYDENERKIVEYKHLFC